MTIIIRKPYGERVRSSLSTGEESMTQQSFIKECDVNNILKKYQKTGIIEHAKTHGGSYEDLSEPCDYQTALNVVIAAQESFLTLPSSVRKRFSNDPQQFLEFVNNPDNIDEMIDMGLAHRASSQAPLETESVAPAEPEPPAG